MDHLDRTLNTNPMTTLPYYLKDFVGLDPSITASGYTVTTGSNVSHTVTNSLYSNAGTLWVINQSN